MRPKRRRQRMIDASGVDTDKLDAFLDQPLGGALAQARRVAEVFLTVRIFMVPSRIDEDDVAGLDRRLRPLQIGWLDQLPLALRDRDDEASAEKSVQRQIADRRRAGDEMDRR